LSALQSERRLSRDGYPGLELIGQVSPKAQNQFPAGADTRIQVYVVGKRVYEFSIVFRRGADVTKQSSEFFDSIHFSPVAAPGAGTIASSAAPRDPNRESVRKPAARGSAVPESDWRLFKSADGGYSVLFPGAPTEKVRTQPGQTPSQFHPHEASVSRGRVGEYLVTYSELLPKELDNGGFNKLRESFRSTFESPAKGQRVQSEHKVTSGDVEGWEFTVEDSSMPMPRVGIMRIRLFLKGYRVFRLMYLGVKSEMNVADVDKFMDSFRIDTK
jgi:hypothetical protein